MPQQNSARRGNLETLQSAQSATGNGTMLAVPDSFKNHSVIVQTAAGVTAGVVTVETADNPGYTGTWISEGTVTTSAGSTEQVVNLSNRVIKAIRARISTTISGGASPSVTCFYVGS